MVVKEKDNIPENVLDKKLYKDIKDEIHADLKTKGTRWGIYASSRLVREYKDRGGRYSEKKKDTKDSGLDRWFREKWINICESKPPHKLVPCGRVDITENEKYPVCRPYHRISPKTPTTYGEIDTKKIIEICRKKRSDPLKVLPKF